jgi:hypothetical protein
MQSSLQVAADLATAGLGHDRRRIVSVDTDDR